MREMTEELKFIDVFPDDAGKLAQRLKIKKDEIPFIRKSYISEKSEVDKKERSVVSYISTITKDRDNEQLLPGGVSLDNYQKNPIVLYGHDYKSLPIGKNIWIKQDERGLIAKTIFAKSEFADQIYRAYTEDIDGTGPLLRGWSVGFIPRKWEEPKAKDAEDAPRRIYTEWELLEYSAVPIPSCPEALTLAYEKGLISDRLKKDLSLDREIEDFQKDGEVVTKPETTDNYHRIPVSAGHEGHKIRTITISAKQGIKALYCVDCKKVKTYLFSTDKWTMEEARAWVDSHKGILDRYERMLSSKDELVDDMLSEQLDELEAKSIDADITLDEPEDRDITLDEDRDITLDVEEDLGNVSTKQIKAVMGIWDDEEEEDEQAITLQELKAILAEIKELLAVSTSKEPEVTIEPDEKVKEPEISEDRIKALVDEKLKDILSPEQLRKTLDETVKLELKRLKGLVE